MSGNNVTLQRNLQIQGFDAIRATGAIVIVFYHYGLVAQLLEGHMYPLHYTPVRYIYIYGYLAVELFFILSGYVMEHTYAAKISQMTLWQFIKKRICRLYPLLLFTTLLTGVEQLIHFEIAGEFFAHPVSLLGIVLTIVGFQNVGISELTFNGPLWQVGILLLMYVLFWGLHHFKNPMKYCVIFILTGITIIVHGYSTVPFLYPELGRGLLSFFIGVALYRAHAAFNNIKGIAWGVMIVSPLLMMRYGTAIVGNLNLTFSMLIFPALLICIVTCKPLARFFSARPFSFLSNISYGIYAYHFPLLVLAVIVYRLQLFPGFKLYSIVFLFGWMGTNIVIALLSKHFLELKLESRLRQFLDQVEEKLSQS